MTEQIGSEQLNVELSEVSAAIIVGRSVGRRCKTGKKVRFEEEFDETIHSKSGISWMEKSADDLEFSAEGLSGNAKMIKFALSGELTL